MKKILAAVSIIIIIAVLAMSCSSGQRCAAYGGERQRYQIERH